MKKKHLISTMYFSIDWKRVWRKKSFIGVEITFLDLDGKSIKVVKSYEEWIGVCTNNIDGVIAKIKKYFPDNNVKCIRVGEAKKILPYFEKRLSTNKLDYRSKPFYKLYTTASHKNVGTLLNCYKIGYFDPDDWLVRIYIDLCIEYNEYSFYYKWYEIDESTTLMKSLKMIPDCRRPPDWTVAAFDIESVPLEGNRVPFGYHESDRIVMVSVYKWNRRQGVRNWLLYLLPEGARPVPGYDCAFKTESEMLIKFHSLLDDAQVLTGYNINAYDLPCIFARSVWLKLNRVLERYSSAKVGSDLTVTYDGKLVVDLYTYFKTFSGYDLPSFKLDDVARVKLKGETKLQVKSTGIWSWYRNPSAVDLMLESDVSKCFDLLKPENVYKSSEFGTFRQYMDYCLKDSELVHLLFEKETVMSFLVVRANFTALNVVQVLHLGNSRYLLELLKTYGTRLGYFFNPDFFVEANSSKYEEMFKGKTYQGALNFCTPERMYENVSVMDFASMYPSTLLSSNLCYGTCTVMSAEEWSKNETAQRMTTIPYREHSDSDFRNQTVASSKFRYPTFDPKVDRFAIVINSSAEAFLPQIVKHFIDMRRHHQKEFKKTNEVYHYNIQLGIKILINSLYGVMANKDSPLAYLPIAMIIVTLSRYQLLGSYHYLKNLGYDVCYADTDSLMVHEWPAENCDRVNEFLSLPYVELKYEQRMKRLLVLSKKRYVYERYDNPVPCTKGFQKKDNGLIRYMTDAILNSVWKAGFEDKELATPSNGWIVWVKVLSKAFFMCRDPRKFAIYRKVKPYDEYKTKKCTSAMFLENNPDERGEHVEFTYGRADVSVTQAMRNVMKLENCKIVNFEKLFISQKRIFCILLNMIFWHSSDPVRAADMVLNTINWKRFVHAELLHWHASVGGEHERRLLFLVEPGVKYTFSINDHLFKEQRKRGRKRKIENLSFELKNLPQLKIGKEGKSNDKN